MQGLQGEFVTPLHSAESCRNFPARQQVRLLPITIGQNPDREAYPG